MRLKWWNTTKMVETQSTLLRGKPASVIALSSDGEFLFAGTTDKRGTLFRIRNGIKQVSNFAAHNDQITGAQFFVTNK